MPLQPHLLFLTEIGALSCTSDLRCSCHLVSCLGGSVKRPGEDCREGRRNPWVSFLLLSQLVVCLTMVVSPLWFRLFLGSCYYSLCLAAYHSHSSHRRSPETSWNFLSFSSSALPHVSLKNSKSSSNYTRFVPYIRLPLFTWNRYYFQENRKLFIIIII